MPVSEEEYQQAKRIRRVTTVLFFVTIYIIPIATFFIIKEAIPKYAAELTTAISFLLIFALGPLGAFDTFKESSEIINKYKKGW